MEGRHERHLSEADPAGGRARTTVTSHGKRITCMPKLANQLAMPAKYRRNFSFSSAWVAAESESQPPVFR